MTENTRQKKPKNYSQTESVIHNMLMENTGISIFDSGGTYGRAWQRNRKITDFREQQRITARYDGEYMITTKDIFHFLTENLEYDQYMDRKFQRFRRARKYNHDIEIMEGFAKTYNENNEIEVKTENSYNSEHTLSQDIQFCVFYHDGRKYIILQAHNGADIRGGYTKPRVFKFKSDYMTFLCDMQDLHACCDCTCAFSDNAGYTWYDDTKGHEINNMWDWKDDHFVCKSCKTIVRFS